MMKKLLNLFNGKSFELEKNSILLFAISMAGSALNYLFQIIIGNKLSVVAYGEFNTLSSLTMIISLTSGVLLVLIAKNTAIFSVKKEYDKIGTLAVKVLRVCLYLGLATCLAGVALSGLLSDAFSLSKASIIFMFLIAGFGFVIAVTNGVLQGTQKFFQYGLSGFISILGKFVFGIILIYLGYSILGLLTAVLLGSILSFMFGYFFIRKYIRIRGSATNLAEINKSSVTSFFSSSFLLQCCMTVTGSIDLLLVNYYFSAEETGVYSSAMVLGRISMYVTSAVVAVAFPIAAAKAAEGRDTKSTFLKSLVYGGGIALASAAFLVFFASPIIRIFFGDKFASAESLLFPVCAFVVPLTLITIIMNYELATGDAKFLCLTFIAGLVVMLVLAGLFHHSIPEMVFIMSATLMLIAVINSVRIFLRPSPVPAE